MKIAAIGEAMIELSITGDAADVRVAGDTLNTAIYLKRCAPDLSVDYITRVGEDAFSNRILDAIQAEEIGTEHIEIVPDGTPGLYAITTDAEGERSFTYWRDASAARMMFVTPQGPNFAALDGYDVIYLSAITLAILPQSTRAALVRWLQNFRRTGGKVAFDSNFRPRLWGDIEVARAAIQSMWAITDIALPSIDDEMALTKESSTDVADRFLAMKLSGALKQGPQGPLCLETGMTDSYPAADRVVDTTAAGDSFNGAYIAAILTGAPQDAALRAGHDMAAEVIGHRGAILPR